jgi:hypothetical protein
LNSFSLPFLEFLLPSLNACLPSFLEFLPSFRPSLPWKLFDEGTFEGTVTSFNSASQFYRVRYTDGDEEDISGGELAAHLGHGSVKGELYKVEKILAHKTTDTQQLLFQVKWQGWAKPTWEPEENLHPQIAKAYISASSSSSASSGFVEQILGHRAVKDSLEFRVLWQGSKDTTWEPEDNLHPQIVQNYLNTKQSVSSSGGGSSGSSGSSSETGGLHIVEKILSHKTVDGKLVFQVRWQGWPKPTWEPEENLHPRLVQAHLSAGWLGGGDGAGDGAGESDRDEHCKPGKKRRRVADDGARKTATTPAAAKDDDGGKSCLASSLALAGHPPCFLPFRLPSFLSFLISFVHFRSFFHFPPSLHVLPSFRGG